MEKQNKQIDDCYYYFNSTCKRDEECHYRHNPIAKSSTTTCTKWLDDQPCTMDCPFRHNNFPIVKKKNENPIVKKKNEEFCYFEDKEGGCTKYHCEYRHKDQNKDLWKKSAEYDGYSQLGTQGNFGNEKYEPYKSKPMNYNQYKTKSNIDQGYLDQNLVDTNKAANKGYNCNNSMDISVPSSNTNQSYAGYNWINSNREEQDYRLINTNESKPWINEKVELADNELIDTLNSRVKSGFHNNDISIMNKVDHPESKQPYQPETNKLKNKNSICELSNHTFKADKNNIDLTNDYLENIRYQNQTLLPHKIREVQEEIGEIENILSRYD